MATPAWFGATLSRLTVPRRAARRILSGLSTEAGDTLSGIGRQTKLSQSTAVVISSRRHSLKPNRVTGLDYLERNATVYHGGSSFHSGPGCVPRNCNTGTSSCYRLFVGKALWQDVLSTYAPYDPICRHAQPASSPLLCRRAKTLFPSAVVQMSSARLHTSILARTRRWCSEDALANPLDDLHALMEVPVISPQDYVFRPTRQEIQDSQSLFRMPGHRHSSSSKGVVNLDDLPQTALPEVCFVGRSNVGKSSLIKALLFSPTGIKIGVSKKPGHTKSLKLYTIGKMCSLVDMPGYGYRMPEYFADSMEAYMKSRTTLRRVFLLIDGSVGLTNADNIGIEMLEEMGRPYTLVLTKIDKTSQHRVLRTMQEVKEYIDERTSCCFVQPFLVSSHYGAGLPLLRVFISHVTGNVKLSSDR